HEAGARAVGLEQRLDLATQGGMARAQGVEQRRDLRGHGVEHDVEHRVDAAPAFGVERVRREQVHLPSPPVISWWSNARALRQSRRTVRALISRISATSSSEKPPKNRSSTMRANRASNSLKRKSAS